VAIISEHGRIFLLLLGAIAIGGLVAGIILALSGYSSAGPFSVAAACVGVLGTLAAQEQRQ
jgi:hypothetical protein